MCQDDWLSCVTAFYPLADLEAAGAWSQFGTLSCNSWQRQSLIRCSAERRAALLKSTLVLSGDGSHCSLPATSESVGAVKSNH